MPEQVRHDDDLMSPNPRTHTGEARKKAAKLRAELYNSLYNARPMDVIPHVKRRFRLAPSAEKYTYTIELKA